MFSVFERDSIISGPGLLNEGSQQPLVKPIRRRDKPQKSCMNCRQKKLKCDREKPCSNCTKRGQHASCDYIKHEPSRLRGAQPPRPATANVQDRVHQLEEMVKSLLDKQSLAASTSNHPDQGEISPPTNLPHVDDGGFTQSAASSPFISSQTESNKLKSEHGKLIEGQDQVSFVGSEHWEAVLEDIADLKIDLESAENADRSDIRPQLWFGDRHVSRSEITSSIPQRAVCDVLISRWFKTMDMAPMIVHVPTFMKEYNQMFEDPDKTPLMWIGLLFSVIGLGSYFYAVSGEDLHLMPERYESMWDMTLHFRQRTAQCLKEVNYLRPKRYTVETLCFYFALEKFHCRDSGFAAYVLSGTIVRVAMRLGYHRDPSHFPSISPFCGEMRRRTWYMLIQLDLSTSAQVGLPRMIRDHETDTAEPKNLLDTDFDEAMTELPHPRPSTFPTPVTFAIFMVRLIRQLGPIIDQLNSFLPPSYETVMKLDKQLMDTHATLPAYLTVRPLSQSITDDTNTILRRYALEVCFQKSRCVLHRKYLIPGRFDPHFRYSRDAAVDAAMKLLDVQRNFHEATQPGGQLYGEQWRPSALVNQDYVLAAMILCLDLTWGAKAGSVAHYATVWPMDKILEALKVSCGIWCELSSESTLAAKASEALMTMLQGLVPAETIDTADTAISTCALPPLSTSMPQATNSAPPFYSNQVFPEAGVDFGPDTQYMDFLSGATDTEMNFNWDLWDTQFQPLSVVGDDVDTFNFT